MPWPEDADTLAMKGPPLVPLVYPPQSNSSCVGLKSYVQFTHETGWSAVSG